MSTEKTPTQIIDLMYQNDAYSQWLGIKRLQEDYENVLLEMTVREEMLNGFGIAHGGISYAFADSAFAFASNSRGRKAVSIETSISHIKAVAAGDILTALAEEEALGNKTAIYKVTVRNQADEVVALFKGTVYRTSKIW